MILYVTFGLVLQTCLCHSRSTQKMSPATEKPKMDRNVYKKTAELIHLINNKYNDEKHVKGIDLDYYSIRNDQDIPLKQIMKLLQKNYDASKIHTNPPNVRVHFISNPEVLEQFRNLLMEDEKNSFVDHDGEPKARLKEILKNLRRQAVFRIDDPSSEEKLVLAETRKVEVIQQTAEDKAETTKQNEEPGIQNSRKKDGESKENADAWDVITKKYDWEKDNSEGKDKNDGAGKGANISDEDKKKDTKANKWDDWGEEKVKSKKGGRDKKNDDTWDNWGQKKEKKDKKKNADVLDFWESNKGQNKKKNEAKIDDWGQKNAKKDKKWEVGQNKKDSWDNWGSNIKVTVNQWDDFDKPKPQKAKVETNKRKGNEAKDKKNDNWDTKWEKKDNWDNWDKTTRQRRKTTRRQSQASVKINEWEHYVPKVQNKPKRYEYERKVPAGAFGRTSIPFVGKKSIYEEK